AGTFTISGAQNNASPATLTVNSGTTANINTNGGSNLSVVNNATTNFNSSQTLGGLTIGAGAHTNVTTSTPITQSGPSVIVTPSLNIAGSTGAWTGFLDLANNKLVVQTGGLSGTALQSAVLQIDN